MKRVFLGLGSNLGRRAAQLERALLLLNGEDATVCRCSQVYRSAPVGPVCAQPYFYNMAAELETALPPLELLAQTQRIETQLGRQRRVAKGPRTIDIDLLLYGQQIEHWPVLDLPHPELLHRAFVVHPLLELDSNLVDPRSGRPLAQTLQTVLGQPIAPLGPLKALTPTQRRLD